MRKIQYDLWMNMTGLGDICHAAVVARCMQDRVSIKFIAEPNYKELYSLVCPDIPFQEISDNTPYHRQAWRSDFTTLAFHTTEYLFATMFDRQPFPGECDFPTLVKPKKVEKKRIIICPYCTSPVRELPAVVFNEIKEWCKLNGFNLTVLGRKMALNDRGVTINSYLPAGIDLTGLEQLTDLSIAEVIEVMASSACVAGLDNGLLHLAAFTDTKVVSAFTSVSPMYRLPYKDGVKGKNVHVVIPRGPCFFCQQNLYNPTHCYRDCFEGNRSCCYTLNSDDFISAINHAVGGKNPNGKRTKVGNAGYFYDSDSLYERHLWCGSRPSVQAE